jgi:ABC-type transport system involved in multi-copper enzyme maturation permease subunit
VALAFQYTRLKARGVVIWGATLGLYSAALVASYTTFSGSAEQMNQLLDAHSREMLEAFGITELAGVENCMNPEVFLLALLAPTFFPILATVRTIAGAAERGIMDVLLGKPIPRWQPLVGGFASIALSLLVMLAPRGALTWATVAPIDVNLSLGSTAAAVLNMWRPSCFLFAPPQCSA